jgi:hypothetical protein
LEFWDKLLRVFLDMVDLLANPFLMDAVVCWKPCSSSWGVVSWEGRVNTDERCFTCGFGVHMFVSVLMNHLGKFKLGV